MTRAMLVEIASLIDRDRIAAMRNDAKPGTDRHRWNAQANEHKLTTIRALALGLADIFNQSMDRFDRDRFMAAAGFIYKDGFWTMK